MHKNNIIVSGDFSAPDISWDTEYSSQSSASDRLYLLYGGSTGCRGLKTLRFFFNHILGE